MLGPSRYLPEQPTQHSIFKNTSPEQRSGRCVVSLLKICSLAQAKLRGVMTTVQTLSVSKSGLMGFTLARSTLKKGSFALFAWSIAIMEDVFFRNCWPALCGADVSFFGAVSPRKGKHIRTIVSFPGIYAKDWACLVRRSKKRVSFDSLAKDGANSRYEAGGTSCVFLPPGSNLFGGHKHPEGDPECWCFKLYGEKADFGCQWFHEWMLRLEQAQKNEHTLVVVYKIGTKGHGKDELKWPPRIANTPEEKSKPGLGISQRGEVAWMLHKNISFVEEDVGEFRERLRQDLQREIKELEQSTLDRFRKWLQQELSDLDARSVAQASIAEFSRHDAKTMIDILGVWEDKAHHDEGFRITLAENGVLELIVQAMRRHAGDADVNEQALWFLGHVCIGQVQLAERHFQIAKAGAVEATVEAMKQRIAVKAVQEAGCFALYNMCRSSGGPDAANKEAAVDAGALELLVCSMQHHAESDDVASECSRVLSILCHGRDASDRRVAAARAGALKGILAAIERFPTAGCRRTCCFALSQVCSGSRECKGAAAEASALKVVTAAMMQHGQDEELQLEGCEVLRCLCSDDGDHADVSARHQGQAAAAGAVSVVLAAMDQFGDNSKVQVASLQALAAVLPGSAPLQHNQGSQLLQRLLTCLQRHVDLEVQQVGACALDRLRESSPLLDWEGAVPEIRSAVATQTCDPQLPAAAKQLSFDFGSLAEDWPALLLLSASHMEYHPVSFAKGPEVKTIVSFPVMMYSLDWDCLCRRCRKRSTYQLCAARGDHQGDADQYRTGSMCVTEQQARSKPEIDKADRHSGSGSESSFRLWQESVERAVRCKHTLVVVYAGRDFHSGLNESELLRREVTWLQHAAHSFQVENVWDYRARLTEDIRYELQELRGRSLQTNEATPNFIGRLEQELAELQRRSIETSPIIEQLSTAGVSTALEELALRSRSDVHCSITIADTGLLEHVVHSMRKHADDVRVNEKALRLLGYVCDGEEQAAHRQGKAAEAGAIEATIEAMRKFMHVGSVQKAGCSALCNMCKSTGVSGITNKEKAAYAKVFEVLVMSMEHHRQDEDSLQRCCEALGLLCFGEDVVALSLKAAAAAAGTLQEVVAAMERFPKKLVLCRVGCVALLQICNGTDDASRGRKAAAVEASALKVVVASMMHHDQDDELQLQGCRVLECLCWDDGDDAEVFARRQGQAAAAGAVSVVLAAMDRFGDNLELLRSATRVLTAVWSGGEHAKETARAVATFSLIIDRKWHHRNVQVASLQALVAVLPGGGRLPPNLGDPLLANLLACLRLQSFDRDLERERLGMLAVQGLRESCPQLDWKEQARVVREMPLDPEMKPVVERLLAIMNQMHAS